MQKNRILTLGVVIVLIVGAIVFLLSRKGGSGSSGTSSEILPSSSATIEGKTALYPRAREIESPSGFVNTDGVKLADIVGKKVILVDFWTYSCINCLRTLPYLTGWYQKYKDQGLEIVGVHTPEFAFEKNKANVAAAAKRFGVEYPVVLDNDYGTWNSYANRYWPHKYLIDIDGFIVYDHVGEGGYDETEKKIQELLAERMQRLGETGKVAGGMVVPQAAESISAGKELSPETYFGADRNQFLGNGMPGSTGTKTFTLPKEYSASTIYLDGAWDITKEFAESAVPKTKIVFRYKAQKVFLVAGAKDGATLRILRDGKPLDSAGGSDTTESKASIRAERLYRLIDDPAGYGEHTLELLIDNPGLQVFTFTFG